MEGGTGLVNIAVPLLVSLVVGGAIGVIVGRTVGPAAIARAVPLYTAGVLCPLWLGWLGLVPAVAIFYLGSLALTWWVLRRAAAAPLQSMPLHAVPAPAWVAANQLQAFGFVPVAALRLQPRGLAEQHLIELVDPEHAAYGQVNAIVGAPRQSLVVVTAYPGGSLRTTSSPVVVPSPGEVVQAFPERPVEELLARHADAQAFLAAQGFTAGPAEAAQAEPFARYRVEVERGVVHDFGLSDVAQLNRRSKAHHRPIAEQPDVIRTLGEWRAAAG